MVMQTQDEQPVDYPLGNQFASKLVADAMDEYASNKTGNRASKGECSMVIACFMAAQGLRLQYAYRYKATWMVQKYKRA
jgi:hypothetical protein